MNATGRLRCLIGFLAAVTLPCLLSAQLAYSGLLAPASAPLEYRFGLDWPALKQTHHQLTADSFQLVDLETAIQEGERRFWGIWAKTGIPSTIMASTDWTEFLQLKWANQDSMVLDHVLSFKGIDGATRFLGIWKPGKLGHSIWRVDDPKFMGEIVKDMEEERRYLVDLEPVQYDTGFVYLALFQADHPKQAGFMQLASNEEEIQKEARLRRKSNYFISDLESLKGPRQAGYMAVYRKGTGKQPIPIFHANLNSFNQLLKFHQPEYQLVDLEVAERLGTEQVPAYYDNRQYKSYETRGSSANVQSEGLSLVHCAESALKWWSNQQDSATIHSMIEWLPPAVEMESDSIFYQVLNTALSVGDSLESGTQIEYYGVRPFRIDQISKLDSLDELVLEDGNPNIPLNRALFALHEQKLPFLRLGYYQRDTADASRFNRLEGTWVGLEGYGKDLLGNSSKEAVQVFIPHRNADERHVVVEAEALPSFVSLAGDPNLCLDIACENAFPVHQSYFFYGMEVPAEGTYPVIESLVIVGFRKDVEP